MILQEEHLIIPLSLEINTCNAYNNKYYYILNYNQLEDDRILYLDLIYGLMKNARVVTKVNSDHWDELIENDMVEIKGMQITLGNNTQHIDIVEIECNTPLLANAYYNKPNEEYLELTKGKVAIKTIPGKESISIGVDPFLSGEEYVSISLYNTNKDTLCTINYGTTSSERIIGNSAKITLLKDNPKTISIINNLSSSARAIVKLGYNVEKTWNKEQIENIKGELYSDKNKYVYKFPYGDNKLNFTNIDVLVKPLKKDSEPEAANIKFCYSTSLGMAIDASKENCFRTGEKIPYTLHFVNPFIAPKIYNTLIETYYVTFSPYEYSNYIYLNITENKYDIEKRGVEGVHSFITLKKGANKDGILLSIPSQSYCDLIFVQLQACVAKNDNINYKTINAFSKEEIDNGVIEKEIFYFKLPNNKMETEIDFDGEINDKVFVKHMGIPNTTLKLENYTSTWIEDKNSVSIIKPIKNSETFNITVIIGKKGSLNDYTLCTFDEISSDQYYTMGDYVYTFTSIASDIVTHFVDFSNITDYNIGTEFDLLIYAVQINKMKVEILYDVISGKVGKIEGVEEINGLIPDKNDYVTHSFSKNITTNNYLYYDFKSEPIGNIASLKITATQPKEMTVSKVSCALVKKDATPEEMAKAVNEAERTYNNLCIGNNYIDINNGYDALINIKDYTNDNNKLVILVKYGYENNKNITEDVTMEITLRTTGFNITEEGPYNEDEQPTIVPYVFDLKKIRQMKKENYHSKVLIYSLIREMEMYYLQNSTPTLLFSGNIMLLYTNEDVIREKYNGASTMILIIDSLSKGKKYFLEKNSNSKYLSLIQKN